MVVRWPPHRAMHGASTAVVAAIPTAALGPPLTLAAIPLGPTIAVSLANASLDVSNGAATTASRRYAA